MPLAVARAAFSHPDWIFELKWDGFRSLAYIDNGRCRLVSRNGNDFKSFPTLSESLASTLASRSAVLDGEIVCLDRRGKPQFRDLLHRRGEPRFVAFDLLRIDGEDLRYVPLMERKAKLRALVSKRNDHLLYCDHVETHGEKLYAMACKKDLEGIVAKRKYDPYIVGQAQWVKIRNTAYSQWEGRQKLFEREREVDPDIYLWDACVAACDMTGH
jgi:bifunctional non-homologous end joining protein LigD